MSKIINGIKELNNLGMLTGMITMLAVPLLIFPKNINNLYYLVLIAYLITIGFAIIQWDRGQYKESNGYLLMMVYFLVFEWSLISDDNKFIPIMIVIGIVMFLMHFYFWLNFFILENKEILRKVKIWIINYC